MRCFCCCAVDVAGPPDQPAFLAPVSATGLEFASSVRRREDGDGERTLRHGRMLLHGAAGRHERQQYRNEDGSSEHVLSPPQWTLAEHDCGPTHPAPTARSPHKNPSNRSLSLSKHSSTPRDRVQAGSLLYRRRVAVDPAVRADLEGVPLILAVDGPSWEIRVIKDSDRAGLAEIEQMEHADDSMVLG